MTYLETLIRILARQRRALRRQSVFALWQVAFFFIMSGIIATRVSASGATPLQVFTLLAAGSGLLLGLFRAAHADSLLGLNTAMRVAVEDELDRERPEVVRRMAGGWR